MTELERDLEALQRDALEVTRAWDPAKTSMALRAAGLDQAKGERCSLDVIAADLGVSRETVRRARNELLHAMGRPSGTASEALYAALSLHAPSDDSADSPATARALRRVLTMTGPLPWDQVLSAWARAGGRHPYAPLPSDVASMRMWAKRAGGFSVSSDDEATEPVTIAAVLPEELDNVSRFLVNALRGQPGGVDRSELLTLAAEAGLKPTTIATTLSNHPAVTRVGRGVWALRRGRQGATSQQAPAAKPPRIGRARPTTFTWSADGLLLIEFSIPRGPSPVVAVPKAVSGIIDGREFRMEGGARRSRIVVRKARLWGFGPALSELGVPSGARAAIALDLLAGTATITATRERDASQ